MARETTWRSLCVQVDPDFQSLSRDIVEYEFSSAARLGNESTHEGGRRVFRRRYTNDAPYGPAETAENGLSWNGQPITWNGIPLTWGS